MARKRPQAMGADRRGQDKVFPTASKLDLPRDEFQVVPAAMPPHESLRTAVALLIDQIEAGGAEPPDQQAFHFLRHPFRRLPLPWFHQSDQHNAPAGFPGG